MIIMFDCALFLFQVPFLQPTVSPMSSFYKKKKAPSPSIVMTLPPPPPNGGTYILCFATVNLNGMLISFVKILVGFTCRLCHGDMHRATDLHTAWVSMWLCAANSS